MATIQLDATTLYDTTACWIRSNTFYTTSASTSNSIYVNCYWTTAGSQTFVSGNVIGEWPAVSAEQRQRLEVVAKRAEALWLAQLTDAQRKEWVARGFVDVLSQLGRRYRIKNYRNHNVFLLDMQGHEVRKYCAYGNDPGGCLPDGDHWFVQLMALRFDEDAFLRAANTWDLLQQGVFVGQGVDADRDLGLAVAA